ncbi:MAG: iron-containing redox enzyme family protein [Acidobacteriota bacterium]
MTATALEGGTPRPGRGKLLERKLRLAEPWLAEVTEKFWEHPRLREMLPFFYMRVYSAACTSIEVMRAAELRCRELASSDAAAAMLGEYLERHIADEEEHPDWLLADLEVLGYGRAEVERQAASASVASLIGPQYYWVHRVHPVALLGYFAVLEGFPPTLEHLEQVERHTGFPRSAFRMLRAHATLDLEHADEIFALLDQLPLTAEQESWIAISAFETMEKVTGVFRELLHLYGDGRN